MFLDLLPWAKPGRRGPADCGVNGSHSDDGQSDDGNSALWGGENVHPKTRACAGRVSASIDCRHDRCSCGWKTPTVALKYNITWPDWTIMWPQTGLIWFMLRLSWQFHIKHTLAKIPNVKHKLAVIFQDGDGVPKPFQRSRCKKGLCEKSSSPWIPGD